MKKGAPQPSGTMPFNAAFPDGRYIVTWEQGGDIYYRTLDYKGDFSGGQIRLDYGGIESNPVVRTLVDEGRPPGHYSVHWDGRDDRGRQVDSGVYLYRLEAGAFVSTRKMVVAR